MSGHRPFLRCPPFPGAEEAATRFTEVTGGGTIPEADTEELAELLARLRVGAAFWGVQLPRNARQTTVYRVADNDDPAAAFERLMSQDERSKPPVLFMADTAAARRAVRTLGARGITVHIGEFDPWSALNGAERFRCVTEDIGDDWAVVAALLGVPVNGQKLDRGAMMREHILPYVWYSPYTGEPMGIKTAIRLLGEYRVQLDRNREIAAAAGIAWWKAAEMRSFLWSGTKGQVALARRASIALDKAKRAGGAVAIWPSKVPRSFQREAAHAEVRVQQIEDGFIRSIGLGSALTPPLSVVVDRRGMYYDPEQPSDLEMILAHSQFSSELCERAQSLRKTIVAAGLSKYGRSGGEPANGLQDYAPAEGRGPRTVLVTGQVEDDRSVELGGGGVEGNLDLLRRVRATEPDATIIFRPHPDIEAGHRRGAVADREALNYADRVVHVGPITPAIEAVDAVHVWTSLAGFEALLRGKEVVTHGIPFFAGWGLTCDLGPVPHRRARTLTLDELVSGTLLLYPRYLDPVTRLPCTPEILIERLLRGQHPPRSFTTRLRALQGRLMKRLGR